MQMPHFDFAKLNNESFKKDFKEDSVREFIISPLLKELGFVLKATQDITNFEEKDSKHVQLDSARLDSIGLDSKTAQDQDSEYKKIKKESESNNKTSPRLDMQLSLRDKAKLQIGSNKKLEADFVPDYTLFIDSKIHCIVDAKAPNVRITKDSKAYQQALLYATHFKAPYFGLCNGLEFRLFSISGQETLLEITLKDELDSKFKLLQQYLTTPLESLKQNLTQDSKRVKKPDSWYLKRPLPEVILNPQKRLKARYFGCTAYFTRQSWDIVTQNIKNFTDYGDIVLDPFGGSGVTALEAMMNERIGIHTDLNPLSIFMAKALSAKVNLSELYELSEEILTGFEELRPKSEKEAKEILKNAKYYPNALSEEFGEVASQKSQDSILWIPKNELLPKGSDVDCVLELFSKKQLAELALLRKLIFKKTTPSGSKEKRIYKRNMRYSLMLAFYNAITVCNLTYHISNHKGLTNKAGNAAAFIYYRYRIAKKPTYVDIVEVFKGKIKRVSKGKKELENSPVFYDSYFFPIQRVIKDFKNQMLTKREKEDFSKVDSMLNKSNGEKIFQADATNLREIESESIDFIYTDPPYGAKIPYLDLSTMWNVWLDLPMDSSLKERECIEKGSLEKTRYDYYDLMKASLKEMYRVLKYNRWLAFIFQHQDPKLWQTIVDSAENLGFEYAGSVRQSNGQTTFKKRQNPSTVLSGQIIIYFKKVDSPKTRAKNEVGFDVMERMIADIETIIIENRGATLEEIWNDLIIIAMNNGYLDLIAGKFQNFIPAINEKFEKDSEGKFHLQENYAPTNYEIPIEKRVSYLIETMLKRAQVDKKGISFDDIVLQVIPLSKNGIQANKKMIKDVLEEIAICDSNGEWKLKGKSGTQGSLFD